MDTLKIRVRDIQEEGLKGSLKVPSKDLGLENSDDIQFIDPVDVNFDLEKVSNTVLAKIKVAAKFTSICSRCLEPVESSVKENLKLNFPTENQTDYIDLGEDIRQEMVMDMPVRLLCKDDCKGLCVHCGVNLNTEKCQCASSL
jgi:uncharacterized protein